MRDYTDITLLLDRSGSMTSVEKDVKGGIKAFIKEQKKAGDNASLTLVQFDTQGTDYVYTATPIKNVSSTIEFVPRGGTPLLDAMGKAIESTGARLRSMSEAERPDKVVFVVYTDGQENSSREYTKERIKSMVEHQQGVYNWQFVFLSSDLNAVSDATHSYGFYTRNSAGLDVHNHSFAAGLTSRNIAAYRSTGDAVTLAYSQAQRDQLATSQEPQ